MALNTEQLTKLRESALPTTGNKLALAIEIAGTTNSAVVAATGFRPQYVSDVACGRYNTITMENAWRFAECFGCDPGALFPSVQREALAS